MQAETLRSWGTSVCIYSVERNIALTAETLWRRRRMQSRWRHMEEEEALATRGPWRQTGTSRKGTRRRSYVPVIRWIYLPPGATRRSRCGWPRWHPQTPPASWSSRGCMCAAARCAAAGGQGWRRWLWTRKEMSRLKHFWCKRPSRTTVLR
jgi:hypothetical protein